MALRRIEAEARSLGFADPELVLEVLDEGDRDEADCIMKKWRKVRSPDPRRYRGELDRAIDADDITKAREILAGFWPATKEFMVILSKTFAKKTEELKG